MINVRTLAIYFLFSTTLFAGIVEQANANVYWVTKQGNDNNGCTNATSDACLTIQKGISLVKAGDTVNVKSGTYVENSTTSPYTTPCSWLDGDPASLCFRVDGTATQPITLQAAPGDEGTVFIDSQSARIGIQTHNSDYIQIKGLGLINNYIIGIASWGQPENSVADPTRLGIGCVIENNYFYNTQGPKGKNISSIGMWGTKDWIVRNNRIDYVPEGAAIQSYGVINALVENNYITNVKFGIFWKDHFVKDATTREKLFESEIRYNKIQSTSHSIYLGIRGSQTTEAGNNYIHHNILYGFGDYGSGVFVGLAGAYGISGYVRIEHNLFDGQGHPSSSISLDANQEAYISGNIFTRSTVDIELLSQSTTKIVNVVESDYNIFDSSFQIIADRYSSNSKTYTSLASWQAAKKADLATLGVDNPDQHSITKATSDLLVNADNGEYQYKSTSAAIGLMPDGTNAGPFQLGSEVIGGVRPKAPPYFDVK